MNLKAKTITEIELGVEDIYELIRVGLEANFPNMKGQFADIRFEYGTHPDDLEQDCLNPRTILTGAKVKHEVVQKPEPQVLLRGST
jgi:hypothetical protein